MILRTWFEHTRRQMAMTILAAAVVAFSVPQIAAAQRSGDIHMEWRDEAVLLGGALFPIVVSPSSPLPQSAVAKVIVANTSAGTRDIECILFLGGASLDRARVRLAAGSVARPARATLSLMVIGQVATQQGEGAELQCVVTSVFQSGVTAEWAKITTYYAVGNISSSPYP